MAKKTESKEKFTLFPKKDKDENIFQYIARQALLSDSSGKPSWTLTILAFVMGLVGIVTYFACRVAISTVVIFDPATGAKVSEGCKGFQPEFMYLIIGLSVVITFFFQQRTVTKTKGKEESSSLDGAQMDIASNSPQINAVAGAVTPILNAGKGLLSKIAGTK